MSNTTLAELNGMLTHGIGGVRTINPTFPLIVSAHGNPHIENPYHEDALKWYVWNGATGEILSDGWHTIKYAEEQAIALHAQGIFTLK